MMHKLFKNDPLTLQRKRIRNGFTLIEVVAALALLSIAMLGLIPMATNALQRSNTVKNRTIAMSLARHKIDELRRIALTTPITSADDSTDTSGVFTRTATVTGGAGLLTTISVTVTWTDYKTNTITQRTLLSQ